MDYIARQGSHLTLADPHLLRCAELNLELVSQLVEPPFGSLVFVVHVNYKGLQKGCEPQRTSGSECLIRC